MAEIAREVREAGGVEAIACVHRLGTLRPGEAAMALAVASAHRGAALAAVETFVARLKQDVPIWKKEHFEDGAVWVGSPDDPQGARARETSP
jgi:molybdopterin synthase catalytic subunit